MFQATRAEKEETRKLIHTINQAVSERPVPKENLNDIFDAMWGELEHALATLPKAEQAVDTKRTLPEMHDRLIVGSALYLQSLGDTVSLLTKDAGIVAAHLVPTLVTALYGRALSASAAQESTPGIYPDKGRPVVFTAHLA
jgi:hypothetical protein